MFVIAEISAIGAFLSTIVAVACAVTVVVIFAGLLLMMRKSTRETGQRALFVAALSVAVDIGLLIVLALLDRG